MFPAPGFQCSFQQQEIGNFPDRISPHFCVAVSPWPTGDDFIFYVSEHLPQP